MSVLPEILATPHVFEHRGKTYKVALVDQNVKAAYENYLYARAKEALKQSRDMYTGREYMQAVGRLNNDFIAGKYAFLSKRGAGSLKTPQGVCKLMSLLFDVDEQEMWLLIGERSEDVTSLLDVIMAESFPGVADKAKEHAVLAGKVEAEAPPKKGVESPAPAVPEGSTTPS